MEVCWPDALPVGAIGAGKATGCWYAPSNGAILRRFEAPAGRQTFEVPPFDVDMALLITPDRLPDSDIKDALQAVKDGSVSAVVAQYPYVIGALGVEACEAAEAGKTLPSDVKAPVELITKANAAQALQKTPKPVGSYDDPFASLLNK